MTRKARLQAWAAQLNAPVPADATAADLEAAIEAAIANPVIPEPDCPGFSRDGCPWMAEEEYPQYSLRDGLAANLAVLRSELPSTIRTVAAQFRG